ncbi:MAG: hypothetical protein Q9194_006104 [Teloschistes cf. exilis]
MKFFDLTSRPPDVAQTKYLQQSIRSELTRRLSPGAQILLDGDENFHVVNERYTNYQRPSFIAGIKVAAEDDVVEVVNYARARRIPFMARTGGHSLTTSPRRIQDGLVIDMRGLNSVRYDVAKQQMTIGGGVTTGEFANATFSRGMEVIVGPCPCTGVMGISLGAGIGRLQGKYGYLNDNMVAIRLLLANGTIITASEDENKDIFWAVRGAGHNFGIALEATFQVYPQENNGEHYVVDFEFELDRLEELFRMVNDVSSPMPQELAIFVIGRKRGATGGVSGRLNMTSAELTIVLQLKPTINVNLVYSGPRVDAQPSSQHTMNFYAANVRKYDIPTMRSFFDGWKQMNEVYEGHAMFSVMFESFPRQGVRAKKDDATAYPWRQGSDHFLMMEAGSKDHTNAEIYDQFLSQYQDAWIESSGYGRLQQYINYGHGSKDPPEALYGYEPWRLERLRALKEELDPERSFNAYQPFVKYLSA